MMNTTPISNTATTDLVARDVQPAPDVSPEELAARLKSIRREMAVDRLDLIVLSDVKNIQYFTDFRTNSWYFSSRPFFALITAEDIVILGATYERAFVESKPRSFSMVYYAGYVEEGVNQLASSVRDIFKGRAPRTGIDYGQEMTGRGSLSLVDALRGLSAGGRLENATSTIWRVRRIKTPFEAELKRTAFKICNDAFDQTIAHAHIGISEFELWRKMQAQTFLNGAESGDPFPVVFGRGDFTYGRPATARRLEEGDYVWADFRGTYGGYPADRNRIARAGEPEAWERDTYTAVRDVTLELCHLIRPGMTCAEFFNAGIKLWAPLDVGNKFTLITTGVGARFGHSGGMGVVEPPSLAPHDETEIRPGMILHVEPKLERDCAVFQFEECVFVTDDGIDFLTPLCPEAIPVIQ